MPASRRDDPLAPVTLVTGGEEFLIDRAVGQVVSAARAGDADTEVHDVPAGSLERGMVSELVSPSLFGGGRVIVLRGAEAFGKDIVAEVSAVLADPGDGVIVVLVHAGGKRGKAVLDAATEAGARQVDCPPLKKYGERLDFVLAEVRRAGGSIGHDGARALLDAVGSDLRELAMACEQLVSDVGGIIGADTVARYYTGRAEATSFSVADRAVEGHAADALEQLRWALATGVAPVLVIGALAQDIRSIAQVRAASGVRSADLAGQLGMPPWKIDRVRRQVRDWTDDALSQALRAVADADAGIKGEAADAAYALERAVVTVARCARA